MERFIGISAAKNISRLPEQENFLMHMHDNYEIYCFLTGDAKYIVEGSVYPLHKGDLVLMRPSESHHILFSSKASYQRMSLSFSPRNIRDPFTEALLAPFRERPLGKLNHYPAMHFNDSRLLHYMEEMCSTKNVHAHSAYLTVLLYELSRKFEALRKLETTAESDMFADILQYINANLTEPLSLREISEHFYISKSQLNRNFKHIIGATVWNYITGKRLLLAKKRLEDGGNPTKIYLECGFNDYSSFYRAYTAKFGIAPSKTEAFVPKT